MKSNLDQTWHSSYQENNYGDFFYALMRLYRPKKVVELGTKDGYSAYHIARGLQANRSGTLDCFDLWETHVDNYGVDYMTKTAVEKNLKEFKKIVKLELADATLVAKKYQMVDILHVDLDNDGEILEKIIPIWIDKVSQVIIIEGGSLERDQAASKTDFRKLPVDRWLNDFGGKQAKLLKETMPKSIDKPGQFVVVSGKKEYKEKPIAPWLNRLSRRRGNIEYFTFEPFPSLTIIRKK